MNETQWFNKEKSRKGRGFYLRRVNALVAWLFRLLIYTKKLFYALTGISVPNMAWAF